MEVIIANAVFVIQCIRVLFTFWAAYLMHKWFNAIQKRSVRRVFFYAMWFFVVSTVEETIAVIRLLGAHRSSFLSHIGWFHDFAMIFMRYPYHYLVSGLIIVFIIARIISIIRRKPGR